MSKKSIDVKVEYLTRVEGHGTIVVNVKEGTLKVCRLEIIESPRFFEGMLRGRSIFEAQHITSRICGICACGHTLASIQAAEDALAVTPSEQTMALRRLLLNMENLDSHVLHIYLLAAPDMLGVKSFIPLISSHEQVVRRALRMKKTCNDVCDILVGRHVHPISAIVGGFTKLPGEADLERMHSMLAGMRSDMVSTIELLATLQFPDFERPTEYVGLVHDGGDYPLLEGDIGSTDGVRKDRHQYRSITNEFIVPHSTARHSKLSRSSYAVGALARFNLNHQKLHPRAREAAETLGLAAPCVNPYLNTVAQAVESVHFLEESIALVKGLQKKGINQDEKIVVGLNEKRTIKVRAGKGVGAVEVPRGLLFHEYEIDGEGKIVNANCIIPTCQNLANVEEDMKKLVPEVLPKKSEAEITLMLEMLVRAYDPCISCSTHFLDVRYVDR